MIAHGTILGGLSTVPDLAQGIAAYRDTLGFELIERGILPSDLARSWDAPALDGAQIATFRPASGEPCWFRLIEQPAHPAFRPTTTFGWAAFECTVEDVWRWPTALPADRFEIVGPPKELVGIEPAFIPMQVLGLGREMLYLNQVLRDMPGSDLPRARSPVDRIFICVLAAPDRETAVGWYRDRLGLERGADFTIPYTMINQAFDLPPETKTTLTMVSAGRMPIVEVDDYPETATARPLLDGHLPPGNALVTLAVRDFDACDVEWIAQPARRDGAPYEGRRAGTTRGPAGELVELVEVR